MPRKRITVELTEAHPRETEEPAEHDYVLSAGFVRLCLSHGLTLAHVGAWAAYHAMGQSVVAVARAALPHRMTTIAIRTKLARVRVALAEERPERCAGCHEHTPRFCLACAVAKTRRETQV